MTAPAITSPADLAPGIYDGLPFDLYLAIAAASSSALKTLAICPAKLGIEREQSAAMRLGSLTHCVLLEPGEMLRRYAPTSIDRRGTKAWVAEEEAAGGRELVKRDEWDEAIAMCDAVRRHPVARTLLSGAATERTLIWADPETGVRCKARLDAHSPAGCPLDVKTAADGSPYAWHKAAIRCGYYLQAAHYLAGCCALGLPDDGMPFIVIEKSAPYVVSVYDLDPALIAEYGGRRISLLRAWAAASESAEPLPGYVSADRIHQLTAPAWAFEE